MVKVSTNFSGNFHIFLRRHHSAKILSDGYLLTKSPFGEVEDKRPKFRIEFSRNFVDIFNSQGSNQAHSATHWGPFQLRHLDIYCNPALYPLHIYPHLCTCTSALSTWPHCCYSLHYSSPPPSPCYTLILHSQVGHKQN